MEYYVVNKLTEKTYFIHFCVLRTLNRLYDNFELDFCIFICVKYDGVFFSSGECVL